MPTAVDNISKSVLGERIKDNDVIEAVQELWAEMVVATFRLNWLYDDTRHLIGICQNRFLDILPAGDEHLVGSDGKQTFLFGL